MLLFSNYSIVTSHLSALSPNWAMPGQMLLKSSGAFAFNTNPLHWGRRDGSGVKSIGYSSKAGLNCQHPHGSS